MCMCILYFVFCIVHFLFCVTCYVQYVMLHILYLSGCVSCVMFCVVCVVYDVMHVVCCLLYNACDMLSDIFYVLLNPFRSIEICLVACPCSRFQGLDIEITAKSALHWSYNIGAQLDVRDQLYQHQRCCGTCKDMICCR